MESISSPGVDDVERAERGLLDALRRADLSATADFLHDDFLITTAGWLAEPAGKGERRDALNDQMTLDEFDLRLIATRRYGDVMVVLAESSQTGTHHGAPYSMTFRYTDVWVREGTSWRLTTRHASGAPSR